MAYKINGTTVINNSGELENVSAVSGPMTINEMPVLDAATNNDLHIKAGWELYSSDTITNNGSATRAIFEAPLPGYYNNYNNSIAGRYDLIHIDVLYFRGDENNTGKGFPGFQLGSNTSSWYGSALYENKGFDYNGSSTSQALAPAGSSTLPSYGYTYRPSGGKYLYPTDHNFVSFSHTIYNANDFFKSTVVQTRAWTAAETGSSPPFTTIENNMSEYWTYPRFTGNIYAIRWLEDPAASVSGNNLSLSYNMYVPQSEYTEEYL